jgi:hypothetical protein
MLHPYRYYIYVKIACATLGVLIEAGWYLESFFYLLRILHLPHLLFESLAHRNKPYPIGTDVIF